MSSTITSDEIDIYDRQIRIWGMEAQKRIRNSTVIMIGLSGLAAEISKNIVLSGIGKLYLLDTENIKANESKANFLIAHNSIGKNRAESCLDKLRILNPNVEILSDNRDYIIVIKELSEQGIKINVLCACDIPLSKAVSINDLTRSLPTNIPFIYGVSFGLQAYFFSDFNNGKEIKTGEASEATMDVDVEKEVEITTSFTSLSSVLDIPIKAFLNVPKRVLKWSHSIISLLTVLKANEVCTTEESFSEFKTKLFQSQDVSIPDSIYNEFYNSRNKDFNPTCAVLGGILSQEIIKAISGKNEPLKNMVIFDGNATAAYLLNVSK